MNLFEMQKKVDSSIEILGGYWKPLSAYARVVEELSEVYEELDNESLADLADELADLFVINCCIANQYGVIFDEELERLGLNLDTYNVMEKNTDEALKGFLYRVGQLGRILNHYDGDKVKKPSETEQTVSRETTLVMHEVFKLAIMLGAPVFDSVNNVLNNSLMRDKNRFNNKFDPSNSVVLKNIRGVLKERTAWKLWGARVWDSSKSVAENIQNSSDHIKRFIKCNEKENLLGFAFEVPTKTPVNTDELEVSIESLYTSNLKIETLYLDHTKFFILRSPSSIKNYGSIKSVIRLNQTLSITQEG
ncbi:MazG nucleotide pyrophosphohydrolase domain-containing protein [Sutcliffiella halmapala]